MKKVLYLLIIGTILSCTSEKRQVAGPENLYPDGEIIHPMTNSKESLIKPYVILVSIDGFRHDYAARYGAKILSGFDASAKMMKPAFPSKTFPNHYTLVTGLYPGNNGLVSNEFYSPTKKEMYSLGNRMAVEDGDYYKGKPLWVLANENQMVSASMFWVGSEAPIQGVYPTYHYKYDGSVKYNQRVNQTIKWLQMPEDSRPHLITLYFSITDDVGHKYGPNSPQIEEAVKSIDETIGYLMAETKKLDIPVNVIVVSDHGMIEVDRNNVIFKEEIIPEGVMASTSFPLMIYSDNVSIIDSMYTSLKNDTIRFRTYKKQNMPKSFHYNLDDERIGDLLIMPRPPYVFGSKSKPLKQGSSTHGYDPVECDEMGAIFYANGPSFIQNSKIDTFESVDIYPLVSHILALSYDSNSIDGELDTFNPILNR